jgi:hypothetical protein
MNTPKPCDTCKNLYYDVMQRENPDYMAECMMFSIGAVWFGKEDCPYFTTENYWYDVVRLKSKRIKTNV